MNDMAGLLSDGSQSQSKSTSLAKHSTVQHNAL